MSYPTLVYKTPGTHQIPGGTYEYLPVQSPDDLEAALENGWYRTLGEAIKGEHADIEDDEGGDEEPATRAELEAKATELGIKFQHNTKDKTLAEKIAFAIEQAKEGE